MSTTTTNFGWTVPSDTDLVKDGAAAIRTALGGVDTSFVDLKGGTTGQVLSKASGTDLDFTWVAQDDSNAIQNAIVDAKGDLIAATAADTPARLAVGTNGQVLTADSTASTGLKWATPTSSAGLTLITSQSFTTSTAINVNSVFSSTYYNYRVIIRFTAGTAGGDGSATMRLRVSGTDATTNYATARGYFFGTTIGADTLGTTSWGIIDQNSTNQVQSAIMDIINPAVAIRTQGWFQQPKQNSTDTNIGISGAIVHTDATAYDGFSIYPASGNVTGTVEVYGYAK